MESFSTVTCSFFRTIVRFSSRASSSLPTSGAPPPFLTMRISVPLFSSFTLVHGSSAANAAVPARSSARWRSMLSILSEHGFGAGTLPDPDSRGACTASVIVRKCRPRYNRDSIPQKEGHTLRKKVTVVGAGNVGANCALRIADKELANVVLVDVVEGVPQGKGLDILQSGPVQGYDVNIVGSNDYEPTANSDIAHITAGFPRKPGMSRDDLLIANYEIVKTATEGVVKYSPNCIIIVVTNPLDAMAQSAYRVSKFPKNRVVGMAGVLDSARFRTFIAQALNVSVENVTGVVMGGHGDTMVPLVRLTNVSGVPLTELVD